MGQEATDGAAAEIKKITYTPDIGDRLRGPVKTIIPVGAFVEIAPGRDAFVHISQLATERLENPEQAVAVGDVIDVVITAVRPDGKLDASRRAFITGEMPAPRPPRDAGPRRDGPRRDGPRFDGPRNDGPRNDGPRNDGPRNNN